MGTWTGDQNNNYVDWSDRLPSGSINSNSFQGLGGNDTIWGSVLMYNTIDGGDGNDGLYGGGQAGIILGGNGNDVLGGGGGNDVLNGGAGEDVLYGADGNDDLRGGTGDDLYRIWLDDAGTDVVNEDLGPANAPGQGGGSQDIIQIFDASIHDIRFISDGNDLLVTDRLDLSDGSFDDGIRIKNFFLGGNDVVEYVIGSEGPSSYIDLTQFLA